MVLLKNEYDILPIKNKKQTILVAGEHADNIGFQCGGGVSGGKEVLVK